MGLMGTQNLGFGSETRLFFLALLPNVLGWFQVPMNRNFRFIPNPSLFKRWVTWRYFEFFIDWGNFTEHARLNGPNHLLKDKMFFFCITKKKFAIVMHNKDAKCVWKEFRKMFLRKKKPIGRMILAAKIQTWNLFKIGLNFWACKKKL